MSINGCLIKKKKNCARCLTGVGSMVKLKIFLRGRHTFDT